MTRRGFIAALLATSLLVPSSAFAYGTPPNNRTSATRKGLTYALGKKIQGAWKAERAKNPTATPQTKVQYKARAKNLAVKINTAAAASAATAAEKKAVMGLVGGMARLGVGKWGTALRAINLIGIGLTVWTIGSSLYDAFWGEDTPKDDCIVGTVCRKYNSDGTYEIRTTTIEYGTSQSSWSLSGGGFWYAYKNTYVSAVAPAKGYYRVHWVWRHKDAGRDVESFDPTTDLYPFTKGVGLTDLQEKLRNKGKLDQAMTRQDIAAMVDTAVAGAIAQDPTDWPAEWTSSSTPPRMDTAGLSGATDDLFNQAVGSLFDPWTDGDADLVDPDQVAEHATDDIADDGSTLPGSGTPTPTPTASPGTGSGGGSGSSGCAPGSAACPAKVDWGEAPADSGWSMPEWSDWMPTPFQQPNVVGECSPFSFAPGGALSKIGLPNGVSIDPCQFSELPQVKSLAHAIGTAAGTIGAGFLLLKR